MPSRYRQDMQRAWDRIAAIPTAKLQTRFGTVEYAERGTGLPILVCHGVLGCHADGVDGWWTNMLGDGFRVIAPSRFGYFGSTLAAQRHPRRPGRRLRAAAGPPGGRPRRHHRLLGRQRLGAGVRPAPPRPGPSG